MYRAGLEKKKCVDRFIKSVENMDFKVPKLIEIKNKMKEEYSEVKFVKIYADVESEKGLGVEVILYGHYELDIDEVDLECYNEEEIKELMLEDGEFIIDDIDFIDDYRLGNVEI